MKRLSFLIFASLLWGAPALALTDTKNVSLNATVVPSCNVNFTAGSLSMTFAGADAVGSATLTMTCDTGLPWSVTVGGGLNAQGELRRGKISTYYMPYHLYADSGYTNELLISSSNTIAGTGTGTSQTATVYGKILKSDIAGSVALGGRVYADTVLMTLCW
ncbi:spore coat U domain-containing protein [Geotalea sp. SG265]|uniref:Csu type fimbrial protein n=1 Tax=Geotalea sp. SG265 TaxID=2922867 RepID=UPI001FAF5E56|nr:spore coat U domain-containing protein [Geotalea sp. SG265]